MFIFSSDNEVSDNLVISAKCIWPNIYPSYEVKNDYSKQKHGKIEKLQKRSKSNLSNFIIFPTENIGLASISGFEFLNTVKMNNQYAAHMWRLSESLIGHNLWPIHRRKVMRHQGLIRSIFTDGTWSLLVNHPINSYLCQLFYRLSILGPSYWVKIVVKSGQFQS